MPGRGLTPEQLLYRNSGAGGPCTAVGQSHQRSMRVTALRYAADMLRRSGEQETANAARLLEQMADDQ